MVPGVPPSVVVPLANIPPFRNSPLDPSHELRDAGGRRPAPTCQQRELQYRQPTPYGPPSLQRRVPGPRRRRHSAHKRSIDDLGTQTTRTAPQRFITQAKCGTFSGDRHGGQSAWPCATPLANPVFTLPLPLQPRRDRSSACRHARAAPTLPRASVTRSQRRRSRAANHLSSRSQANSEDPDAHEADRPQHALRP